MVIYNYDKIMVRLTLGAMALGLYCLLLPACKKDDVIADTVSPITIGSVHYHDSIMQVNKGVDYVSGVLQLPTELVGKNVTFSISDVKNADGKSVSTFFDEFVQVGWTSDVDKSRDNTLALLLAKYAPQTTSSMTINPSTGALTFHGKGTASILAGKYTVDIALTYEGQTKVFSNACIVDLKEGRNLASFSCDWSYGGASSPSARAAVSYNQLSGSSLTAFIDQIGAEHYDASRVYLIVRLADARSKLIDWRTHVMGQVGKSTFASANPWVEPIYTSESIIISSPVATYPVVASDTTLYYSIPASLTANKKEAVLTFNLYANAAGVYHVTFDLSNQADGEEALLSMPEGKQIYIPQDLRNVNFSDDATSWSHYRMDWSDNFVVFWAPGYGRNPSVSTTAYHSVDIAALLGNLENYYAYYRNEMKFLGENSPSADNYRVLVMLYDQADWLATGSGYDRTCGAMWINGAAAGNTGVMAHEAAHTFQYMAYCDGNYAFTGNYDYIGGFWEQSAQYQASLIYPLTNVSYLPSFISNAHLHLLHETNRYSSFYLLQYWQQLRGIEILGKIWRGASAGEDAVEAYKRITGTGQSRFNDEVYDYAARNLTWHYTQKAYYTNYVLSSSTNYLHRTSMNLQDDGYYLVSPSNCVQSYGFNALELTVPATGSMVSVDFTGVKGHSLYNNSRDGVAGWRWGFVAIKSDGTAQYGTMQSSGTGQASFTLGSDVSRLYLVVSGAPTQHIRHAWDDNDSNDEQFPWKAKFTGTTVYVRTSVPIGGGG